MKPTQTLHLSKVFENARMTALCSEILWYLFTNLNTQNQQKEFLLDHLDNIFSRSGRHSDPMVIVSIYHNVLGITAGTGKGGLHQ